MLCIILKNMLINKIIIMSVVYKLNVYTFSAQSMNTGLILILFVLFQLV